MKQPSWTRLRFKVLFCGVTCILATWAGATFAEAQVQQTSKNGCTSPQAYSGSLTSPPFSPSSQGENVTFQAWFEVESVAPDIFDQIILEYIDLAETEPTWIEFDRLNREAPTGGAPDQPFSNGGLGVKPSFQLYSIPLPVGDRQDFQIRFRFETVDDTFQGFRGVGIDEVLLPEFGATVEGFENGAAPGWAFDPPSGPGGPSWQILTDPQNVSVRSPEINPELVTLPDLGALPAAAAGKGVAWFGNVASGTFCGPDFANRVQQPPAPDTTPPETAGGVGPSGLVQGRTATFSFSSNEPGSTFECSLDDGAFTPCTSPLTLTGLSAGAHVLRVRALDASGNVDPTPTVFTFSVARTLADLPAPEVGETVNVGVVRGTVLIAVPAGAAGRGEASASQKGLTFVPLEEARQVPVGSFLDTKRGTVQLVSATGAGAKTQSGQFSAGLFQALQSRKRSAKGLTELRLKGSSFKRCRARGADAATGGANAAQLSRRTIRRLRSSAKGRFRTRGRHSAATIRGTVWITADRCDGTLTQVKRGKVAVRDLRRKRTITLTAGKSYLARAPR